MEKKYEHLSEDERWKLYPIEKAKIQKIPLKPEEYEREIRKICDRLGI